MEKFFIVHWKDRTLAPFICPADPATVAGELIDRMSIPWEADAVTWAASATIGNHLFFDRKESVIAVAVLHKFPVVGGFV